MTDETRRFLTEKLGECYHEEQHGIPMKSGFGAVCCKCQQVNPERRTFTTAQDAYDLEQSLVREGKLPNFFYWCLGNGVFNGEGEYLLLREEHRCQLIADFWMEQGGKKTPPA